jgi:hypothetical protein
MRDIALYVGLTLVFFVGMTRARMDLPQWASLSLNTLMIILFVMVIVKRDFPLRSLPLIGKYFK